MLSGLSDYELWELAGAGDGCAWRGKQTIFRENEMGKKLLFPRQGAGEGQPEGARSST